MTDATHNPDQLTLNQCLEAMTLIGGAPEDYVVGYEHGFKGSTYDYTRSIAYARGRSAGLDAWGRGAHGAEQPTWAPPEILPGDIA